MNTSDSLLTPSEVAAWLRISTTAVYALCDTGDIACHRIGLGAKRKRIRIHRSAVEKYLADTANAVSIIPIGAAKVSRSKSRQKSGVGFALLRAGGWKG